MKIARVFPRRTNLTPTDEFAFVNCQPNMLLPEIDAVHISVTFTADIPIAEKLFTQWESVGVPVEIGGPAFGIASGEFTPGMYLEDGAVFTSRGCPNDCWFCGVPKIEGPTRELKINEGWNVLDDNLLACSDEHVKKVFEMLSRQPHKAKFSGGLEAAKLKPWHAQEMKKLHPERLYFAYDMPGKRDALFEAGKILRAAGFTTESHVLKSYVLIGYPDDTFEDAEKRLTDTIKAGFMPFAMLYRADWLEQPKQWRDFQRIWVRQDSVGRKMKELRCEE